MQILLVLLALCLSISSSASDLSTDTKGSFQALAQSPDSIAVYWRHEGRTESLYSDGKLVGVYPPNSAGSFTQTTVSSLTPNTNYTFSLGESGPVIKEKTWSLLPSEVRCDLLVIGGTASGVAAAVLGARQGLNVVLVESTNRLGGMSSNGLGNADISNKSCSNGFFEEFRGRVAEFYGSGTGFKFESRVANAVIKLMVYEQPCITLFLKSSAIRPILAGNRVCGAEVCDMTQGKAGRIYAKITIDATDTADFAAASGAEWRVGREQRSPNEPHAGEIYFDDAAQTILPGSTGKSDTKTQSYAYFMILKDYGENGAPLIERPRFYDPEIFSPSPEWSKTWNATAGVLPNNHFEVNTHPFGTDWPGINFDYPVANTQRRHEIDAMYQDRALGYLYFLQNERGHKNLGLADDEFLDNGNFPVGLYIREARRIIGEHILAENEVTNARTFHRADSVGVADYPMDSHAMEDLKDPTRKDKGEGEIFLRTFTPWQQLPYSVMVPKRVENLLVTTAVSATHIGYGTLRMEPARMSYGQAAAAAAYLAITRSVSLRCINPAWIQDRLLSQHAYIYWYSDVKPTTRHFKAINFLAARGVFPNEPKNTFRPDENMTEEEAIASLNMLLALEGCNQAIAQQASSQTITRGRSAALLVEAKAKVDPAWRILPSAQQTYVDVPLSSPYYSAIEMLAAHRITPNLFEGYEAGMFKPDAPITRADAAEAIYLAHRNYAMNYWRP